MVTKKDKTVYVWNNGVYVAQVYNYGDGKVDPACDSKCTKLAIPNSHFTIVHNNGEILHAAAIPGNAIEIRDAISGSPITTLPGHTFLRFIAFSNDGTKIITVGYGSAVKIWDAAHGTLLMTLEEHERGAEYAAFNRDDTLILTLSNDYTARVWDASNGICKAVLGGQKGSHLVTHARFNPQGTKFATLNECNKTIKIWDAVTGACHLCFDCNGNDGTKYVKFTRDADRVVTRSKNALRTWNMDGTYLEYLREDLLKLSPSGKLLAIYSADELLTIVNCADGKTISQRQIPNVQRICWNPRNFDCDEEQR